VPTGNSHDREQGAGRSGGSVARIADANSVTEFARKALDTNRDGAAARCTEGRDAMWENFIIMAALSFIKETIKNPAKAATLKVLLLEIRDDINLLFPQG
jgi:hypothetical protein